MVRYTEYPINWRTSAFVKICGICNAMVPPDGIPGHDAFHEGMIPREDYLAMSNVLWCDPGDHAFKAGMPGSQRFNGTVIGEDGESITQLMDACPEHSFSMKRKSLTAEPGNGQND